MSAFLNGLYNANLKNEITKIMETGTSDVSGYIGVVNLAMNLENYHTSYEGENSDPLN